MATLVGIVQPQLDALLAVKKLVDSLKVMEVNFDTGMTVDITDALANIPVIPVPNLGTVLSYLTCPLTPLALVVDPSKFSGLDPRAALAQIRKMYGEQIQQAVNNYIRCLDASVHFRMINRLQYVIVEWRRLKLDPTALAKAVVITATVKATCGYTATSVFGRFEEIMRTFALGSHGLPADIGPKVLSALIPLMAGEQMLDMLQLSITASISLPQLPDVDFIAPTFA
jgi:hypothetical protein